MELPMAFSEPLAQRIRKVLRRRKGIEEKKTFGGLCFMMNGHMFVGVWKDSMIARLGLEQEEVALLEPHVRRLDIKRKPMKGWIVVEPDGVADDSAVKGWVQRAVKFVAKLPAK
jgi:hypothetical protein